MNLANATLSLVAAITRQTPALRGLGRTYRTLNGVLLRAGAKPLVIARMKDGTRIRVDLRTNTDLEAYYRGRYDGALLQVLHAVLDVNSVVLDIGANIGFYSVSLAHRIKSSGGKGRVIAFEPFAGNYQRLLENLEINDLRATCDANPFGLSDESRETEITLREDFAFGSGTGNASIPVSESFDAGFDTAPISLRRLDVIAPDILRQGDKIDLIKMDIEGHEDFCLAGARDTLSQHRPTILMEVNKPYYQARGVDIDELFFQLIPQDYRAFRESGGKWREFASFTECSEMDNVFLIPSEKLSLNAYQRYFEAGVMRR